MEGKKKKSSSIRKFLHSQDPFTAKVFRSLVEFKEETAELDYKENFDPNLKRDWIRLAKHIIAMANTRGGYIILGVSDDCSPVGINKNVLKSIDKANIYNKVNSFIEPDIEEIRYNIFRYQNKHFGFLFIPKSINKTHVVKKTGNYQDEKGRITCGMSKGHIYVRHGAKSEPLSPSDLSRILNERIQQHKKFWMEGIRKISTAKIPAEVIISTSEKGTVPIRLTTDPRAPQVRGILDRDKCKTIHEEMICGLKAWKARPDSFLTIPQLAEVYSVRKEIDVDEELAEFIIRSSFSSWMPVFFWSTKISRSKFEKILRSVIKSDEHPSARECLKSVLLLDKKFAKNIFKEVLDNSHLNGAKSDAEKFLRVADKNDRYKVLFNIGSFVKYYIDGKENKVRAKDLLKKDKNIDFERLLDEISYEFAKNPRNSANKWALKILDTIFYGFKYLA